MKIWPAAQVAALVIWAGIAHAAPVWSEWGRIQGLNAGWTIDVMAVIHGAMMANPAGCTAPDAYVTDPADSGHLLFNSMLMSAFLNNKEVRLLVDGCAFDRPHLIAVNMR